MLLIVGRQAFALSRDGHADTDPGKRQVFVVKRRSRLVTCGHASRIERSTRENAVVSPDCEADCVDDGRYWACRGVALVYRAATPSFVEYLEQLV